MKHCHFVVLFSGGDLLAVNVDGDMPYDICEESETLDYIETTMTEQGKAECVHSLIHSFFCVNVNLVPFLSATLSHSLPFSSYIFLSTLLTVCIFHSP